MANHMSSFPIPCKVIMTENVDVHDECLTKGLVLDCIRFDPVNNEYSVKAGLGVIYTVPEDCIDLYNEDTKRPAKPISIRQRVNTALDICVAELTEVLTDLGVTYDEVTSFENGDVGTFHINDTDANVTYEVAISRKIVKGYDKK